MHLGHDINYMTENIDEIVKYEYFCDTEPGELQMPKVNIFWSTATALWTRPFISVVIMLLTVCVAMF